MQNDFLMGAFSFYKLPSDLSEVNDNETRVRSHIKNHLQEGWSDLWSDFEQARFCIWSTAEIKNMSLLFYTSGRYAFLGLAHTCFLCQPHN